MQVVKWLIGGFVLAVVLSLGVQAVYANKALPGTSVGDESVGGKEADQVATAVLARTGSVKDLTFDYRGQTFTVTGESIGLKYDATETGKRAVALNRGSFVEKLLAPYQAIAGQNQLAPVYTFDGGALAKQIEAKTSPLEQPAVNANVVRSGTTFRIAPEKDGSGIEPQAAVTLAQDRLNKFESRITLKPATERPVITRQALTPAKAYAESLAAQPLQVTAGGKQDTVDGATIARWVTFRTVTNADVPRPLSNSLLGSVNGYFGIGNNSPIGSAVESQRLVADLDATAIGQYVAEFAPQVDAPPVNARLAFADGALKVTGAPKDGTVVDRQKAVAEIQTGIRSPNHVAALPIVAKQADIREETIAKLGIKTLVGKSTTTFGGSPAGRTFNIGVGASKFNGVLIKPGEEFSFNQTLGDVGPETGYVPELVILEKTTEKQYGGGLCQVSTTMFRAAMDAGLPITDRSNHSYAVSYYAPIGMDATIYPPDPDMKFINNTPGYILVQTAQVGQSVTFEFYGTSDGRESKAEVMYINATEAAGGTAAFRYTVSGGPQPIDRVFTSTYKPHSAFPIANSLN